jgi:hypothetical protein
MVLAVVVLIVVINSYRDKNTEYLKPENDNKPDMPATKSVKDSERYDGECACEADAYRQGSPKRRRKWDTIRLGIYPAGALLWPISIVSPVLKLIEVVTPGSSLNQIRVVSRRLRRSGGHKASHNCQAATPGGKRAEAIRENCYR